MEPDLLDRRALADRLEIVRSGVQASMDRLTATKAQIEESRENWTAAKAQREVLHESAYARLLARFETQPVIEQAKGILMAESHCSADEAFEMLRRASQRQNTRVRDLATQIVARASNSKGGNGSRPRRTPTPPTNGN